MRVFNALLAATSVVGITHGQFLHSKITPVKPALTQAHDSGNPEAKAHGRLGAFNGHTISPREVVQTAGDVFNPKNIASPEAWTKFREKGNWLGCLTRATDEEAGKMWPDPLNRTPKSARSQWQGDLTNELHGWGWLEGDYNQDEQSNFRDDIENNIHHIGSALQALGLSLISQSEGGHNVGYSIEHGIEPIEDDDEELWYQTYKVGNRVYHSTGAYFRFTMNGVGGAIFAQMFLSPRYAAEENWGRTPAGYELPDLRLVSDVLWAYWVRQTSNPGALRYYFALTIQNGETLRLLAKVYADKKLKEIPKWPGIEVATTGADAAAGEALLGSPIGATLAYFLNQHKAELGLKQVTSVTIFRDNWDFPNPHIHLLYKIEDYEPPEPETSIVEDSAVYARSDNVSDHGKQIVREHVFRLNDGTITAKL